MSREKQQKYDTQTLDCFRKRLGAFADKKTNKEIEAILERQQQLANVLFDKWIIT